MTTMLDTDLFKTFYVLIITLAGLYIMLKLVQSAMESMKRTGGKLSSIFDELAFAVVLFAIYAILVQLSPSEVIEFVIKPVKWLWGMILQVLRNVGVPV